MIRIILLKILFISNLLALGGMDSLPSDQKKFASAIKDALNLSDKDTLTIYRERVGIYFNTKNWSAYWYGNDDVKNNKISNSQNKTMFLTLLVDDRIVNISFVKFASQKQIVVYVLETLPRTQQVALDKFNELEKNVEFKKSTETPNFAYFSKDGYTSKVNIFVAPPVGNIQFSNYYLYDITN